MSKDKIMLLNGQVRKGKRNMTEQPSASKYTDLNEYLQAMETYQAEITKTHTKDPAKQNMGFLQDEIDDFSKIAEQTFSTLPSSLDDLF